MTPDLMIYPDGRLDSVNAAKYIGAKPKTLAQWRCEGKGPQFIKRGRIFYFKEDLDIWLIGNGKAQSTAQARLGIISKKG
jgi:hypothetical protein